MRDNTTFVTVTSGEGFQRHALIACGVCRRMSPMQFYESPGFPLFDAELLFVFHYDACDAGKKVESISIHLRWHDGRPTQRFRFNAPLRTLQEIAG